MLQHFKELVETGDFHAKVLAELSVVLAQVGHKMVKLAMSYAAEVDGVNPVPMSASQVAYHGVVVLHERPEEHHLLTAVKRAHLDTCIGTLLFHLKGIVVRSCVFSLEVSFSNQILLSIGAVQT
jgi:hypothetical protein